MSSKKCGIHFFKTTVIGELVFLVPVVVFLVVLVKAAGLMMMVAEPMTAYMENVERFGQGTNELLRALHDSPTAEKGENP